MKFLLAALRVYVLLAPRTLAAGMFDLFEPLHCNHNIASKACEPWSTVVGTSTSYSNLVKIDCGTCVTMDLTGPRLDFYGGLDILGKLVIPDKYTLLVLYSTMIVVQGELDVRSMGEVGPEPRIKFVLTGDQDRKFIPMDNNAGRCRGEPCNAGKKGVIVAGGKVTFRGLPRDTPSWLPIYDVVTGGDSALPPGIDLKEFPQYRIPPFGCNLDGILVDMATGRGGNDIYVGSDGSSGSLSLDGSLKVEERATTNQGAIIDLRNVRSCLRAGRTYIITARVKLSSKSSGFTSCSSTRSGCLLLALDYVTPNDVWRRSGKWRELPSFLESNGVEFTIAAEFTLTEEEAAQENIESTFRLLGPQPEVDIHLMDFTLREPPQTTFATAANVCVDLVLGNGDAERVGYSPFPFRSNPAFVKLMVKREGGSYYGGKPNSFFQVGNRDYESYYTKANNWKGSGLYWSIPNGCLVRGTVFYISFKARAHPSPSQPPTVIEMHMKTQRIKTSPNTFKLLAQCPPSAGHWVSCRGVFTATADQTDDTIGAILSTEVFFATVTESGHDLVDVQYDLDDLSIVRQNGPTSGLVVSSAVVEKWGVGSEVLITSHTQQWDADQVRSIAGIRPSSQRGYMILDLNSSFVRPTTQRESPEFVTEVALLSRNIRFESTDDDVASGGHFMIMRTSSPQDIEGVEFRGFGQQGTLGRYPIHFHFCGDAGSSKVVKVLIRKSNQRGVVVHGSHNLTVHDNVAYDIFGHCYMLEDGLESGNRFTRNLGARVKNIPSSNLIPDNGFETDDKASIFWMTNPTNSWSHNVAAGSEGSGFWLELSNTVRGVFAGEFEGFNPKKEPLISFEQNVAHSNGDVGFRTYPNGYIPDARAVFVGLRSYRNRGDGVFFHASQNLELQGSTLADNSAGIEIDRAENVVIRSTDIIGVSRSYKMAIEHQAARSVCGYAGQINAVDLHTYTRDDKLDGTRFVDVTISGMQDTPGCTAVAFQMDGDVKLGAFDHFTSFEGVRIVDSPAAIFDFCDAEASGVEDIYLIDTDGSLLPPEFPSATGSSAVISDRPSMFHFLTEDGNCVKYPGRCYAYCRDTCFQTMTYKIPYPTQNKYWKLQVCRDDYTKCKLFRGGFEYYYSGNVVEDTDIKEFRYFPVHLPPGKYRSVFLDESGKKVWPAFVEEEHETPLCEGTLYVALDKLVPSCDDLVFNGDFSAGTDFWAHSNGSGIRVVHGGGMSGSDAVGNMEVVNSNDAISTFLDQRCLNNIRGELYVAKAWVKLDGAECNPANNNCPQMAIRIFDGSWKMKTVATAAGKVNADGFILLHGVVEITDEIAKSEMIQLHIIRNSHIAKMIVDNVSFSRTARSCANAVRNSGFEDGDHSFWERSQFSDLSVVTDSYSGQYALQMSKATAQQFLRTECFQENERYEVKAHFKIFTDEFLPFKCSNHGAITPENRCPEIDLYGFNSRTNKGVFVNAAALAVGTINDGWNQLYGQFTVDKQMVESDRLRLTFDGFASRYSVVVDDVSISKLPFPCPRELVVNSNFELGFETFFQTLGSGSLFNAEDGIGISNRVRPSHGMIFQSSRWLNFDCIGPGDQLEIFTRVRLVNNDGKGKDCNPSQSIGFLDDACPSILVRVLDSAKRVILEESQRGYSAPWDKDAFNALAVKVRLPDASFWDGEIFRFDVVIKDSPKRRTILIDTFSIRHA